MKLVIGLGNPGKKYETTRHNVGFLAIDKYCYNHNLNYSFSKEFNALYVKTNKAIFVKPETFMNLSGESVIKFINYFKIDIKDLLIIYDDISIPFNALRLRDKGSAGGHNGIKSIIANIKTEEFKRVRIGVDSEYRKDLIEFVLGNFSKIELKELDFILDDVASLIDDFINDKNFEIIMTNYNKKG